MKKIKFNILAAGALCLSLGAVSCTEGFLDVESKTESTTGNFYNTMVIDVLHVVMPLTFW